MIDSLRLVNFQKHSDTYLEFSPGVNVIVGKSRQGKTSIIRALKWVVENRPSGEEFRKHGTEETFVVLELNDVTVGRLKNNQKNLNNYYLNEERFQGFGQSVPEPIKKALNLSDINVQDQFDPGFLLFQSSGEVARYLNQVVHLDIIDKALSNITTIKRGNDNQIHSEENRLKELKQQKSEFPDLLSAEEYVILLEERKTDFLQKSTKCFELENTQIKLKQLREYLTKIKLPDWVEEKYNTLEQKLDIYQRKAYTHNTLVVIQSNLNIHKTTRDKLQPIISKEETIENLINKRIYYDQKKKGLSKLNNHQLKIEATRIVLEKELSELKKLQEKFKKLMPNQCPLCGRS